MENAHIERSAGHGPGESAIPVKVIRPTRGWRGEGVSGLWAYRDLLAVLVLRDLRVRYKQSVLGAAWVVLRPLGTMAIFTAVFGFLVRVPSDGFPYAPFVMAGLLPWLCFSSSVLAGGSSLVSSAGLIGKVSFPRMIVPLAACAGGFVDLLVSTAVLLAILPLFGIAHGVRLLALPALLVPLAACTLGAAILVSALSVAYRDAGSLSAYVLQLWMYATPVVFPSSLVPGRWRPLLALNPMAGLVEAFRSATLGRPFDPPAIAGATAVSLLFLALGVYYFGTVERRFADVV
jgi:lipopolysaccharide transport system permease protein